MGDIKICPVCKGEGRILLSIDYNDHELSECGYCKGSGKIYQRMYMLEIPFDYKNDSRFHKVDKNILDNIHELRKSLT